ncbi:hypothetical protein N0V84_008449 [Fusarium piperis]|uniref:Peptidase S8/S53 domain-containing protein n=1 Tax=Fusarium piperis TaxID=1435070 RepID=A0A9W8W845_9HYPO|nr:hypothetical protein N0V84_008449 [Fusarium piperis]
MDVLTLFGLKAIAASNCVEHIRSEDMYELLVAVLPTFNAIAERACSDVSDPQSRTHTFYIHFYEKIFSLQAFFQKWDPTEIAQGISADEVEVKRNLVRVLDELENRFVSKKGREAGPAFQRLGFERRDEAYPKLQALKRILPDDGTLSEDFFADVNSIIRIDNKSSEKRESLLQNLSKALHFFYGMLPSTRESGSPCPLRFEDYPLKHVWKLTKKLFDVVQRNWCCQCSSHAKREARLNLTQCQRFETALVRGQVISSSEARFRILFPITSLDAVLWQDTEIAVKNRDHEKREHKEIERGLCNTIQGVRKGIRPRMVVFARKLWKLRVDIEDNQRSSTQVLDSKFRPLKELLQQQHQGQRHSPMALMEGKDRLILSFILATSLLHFFSGPWLQAKLTSETICFLVSNSHVSPDITKPYLTTACCSLEQEASPSELDQPHQFPYILSLGILLLEIARGTPVNLEKAQDPCVVALDCFKEWDKACGTGRSTSVRDGLHEVISACIDPRKLRQYFLDKPSVKNLEVRQYIFERILHPLENALSTAYGIQLNKLHADIARAKEVNKSGSFDHRDEHRPDKEDAAREWLSHWSGVSDLLYDCEDRLSEAAKRATRVKVAVIDTGLQLPGALQENYEDDKRINVDQSKAFILASEGQVSDDWRVDPDGHGSRVGQIILKVAPGADLHVAKVFRTKDDLEDPDIANQVHDRIAKAIKHATNEWKVDIIVMSFGFDETIPLIRNALVEASKAEKPPLFFAATRNDGAHKRMAWPARDSSVIGISSTDGNGLASPFNPSDKDTDSIMYAFGEGFPVEVAAPGNSKSSVTKYISGTSYAAPVAAALAASLLGCVRMVTETLPLDERNMYQHVPSDLQRMSGMIPVLRRHMQKQDNHGLKSLLPWDFLKPGRELKVLKDVSETLKKG